MRLQEVSRLLTLPLRRYRQEKSCCSVLDQLLIAEESFAIETTLTTIGYLKTIARAQSQGYRVTLLFVWLSSAETAIGRVRERVAEGGHHKGLANMARFLEVVEDWYLYDNSGSFYELVAKRVDGHETFLNFEKYKKILLHGQ